MAETDESRREGVGLEDYLRVLRDRAWVIVVCVAVVLAVVLTSSLRTTPLYRASAGIVYEPTDVSSLVTGYQIFAYDYDRDRTIETAIAAVGKNETIAEAVQGQLQAGDLPGADLSPEELSGMVAASASAGTNFVTISATSTDPEEAAAVANAFADQFVKYRQDVRQNLVIRARDLLESQLAAMTPEERNSEAGLLQRNRYEQLRVALTVTDSDFKPLDPAGVPGAAFTPQTRRDVILALVLGVVLGVGLAFLLDYLDRRIKDEKTLEKLSGLPVLVGVPVVGRRGWRRRSMQDRSSEVVGFASNRAPLLESFRTLRSTLQYFNVDGNLRKILITSGLPGEGKTVTTINLAISMAMSGRRVIILEADLRRPMLHEYLGLVNDVGLSNLLAGVSSVPGAMQLVQMDPLIPTRSRKGEVDSAKLVLRKNLYCITSGPLPPNPNELLQSARMAEIVTELEGLADYVLVDYPSRPSGVGRGGDGGARGCGHSDSETGVHDS